MLALQQSPPPGAALLRCRGDILEFALCVPDAPAGRAWLRTNLGRGAVRRREIAAWVERERPILSRDWHDIPMPATAPGRFAVRLPLLETGFFEAKACFLPDAARDPLWPAGPNATVKVAPPETAGACMIYTAFVRQFGPNRERRVTAQDTARVQALDAAGYAVIPRSGTFRDLARELDFIIGTLGFRILQLLPIHPTPTVYGRMGRFGSPYAAQDFMDVDPALAEFDRRTTPLDQFRELLDGVHARHARLFLDIPINHTGWASWLQIHHPEWFARNEDRSFQSPGAWGVTWEDLSKLDYRHHPLWTYMAEVFLFWCEQGVDGFRCDAGYMIPPPVWQYLVAKVRERFPDTVFLLEGLGGTLETTRELLSSANLDWAYSELFQTYDQSQIDRYLPGCIELSASRGPLVHFAETHDNPRLAAVSHTYARFRTALSALCSQHGAFGLTNGAEWFATEKIDVHDAPSLNWNSAENQVPYVARLNTLLRIHPSFQAGTELRLIHEGAYNTMALLRTRSDGSPPLLVLANFNDARPALAVWTRQRFDPPATAWHDLLSGAAVNIERHDRTCSCLLQPRQALCLTPRAADLQDLEAAQRQPPGPAPGPLAARLRAKLLETYAWFRGPIATPDEPLAAAAAALQRDPRAWCRDAAGLPFAPVVRWSWPRDLARVVMLPPGQALLISAPAHFTAELRAGNSWVRRERSLPGPDAAHFALLLPPPPPAAPEPCTLTISLFEAGRARRERASLLRLPERLPEPPLAFSAADVAAGDVYGLCVNGRGAMAQVRGHWGELRSQYDALLAANLDPAVPVDRHVLFTRCRAWVVHRGYSQELGRSCLERFAALDDGSLRWEFYVPCGMGKSVRLDLSLRLLPDRNAVVLGFSRRPAERDPDALPDAVPHRLILRPDLEDRVCHATTKAYLGPETSWPAAVAPAADGFVFAPAAERRLRVRISSGSFTPAPEWTYMVPHPFELDRGLNGSSDLFSPGFFAVDLTGGAAVELRAEVEPASPTPPAAAPLPAPAPVASDAAPAAPPGGSRALRELLARAIGQFIVRRGAHKTIIAGYPWFLDWGRDTLIALRGVIAAGRLAEARDILLQFAALESQGTLPNLLQGSQVANRDTSDSPLWLFVACRDLLRAEGRAELLDADAGGRPLREILRSIAAAYARGTPNGIVMDPASALIFSPAHFTWMDTNHPAATPRQGYPIEIQALWIAALNLLAEIDPTGAWAEWSGRAAASLRRLYIRGAQGFLSDCLHAAPGTPAAAAAPDDALRPNQLLAITLGAVADLDLRRAVLEACEELLVPGAIRSLADRPVAYPLPVWRDGALLNDPHRPYWGRYRGDEDTRRKPAYHNGTAWTWLYPSYAEALLLTYGPVARPAAAALLGGSVELLRQGCAGHLAEIVDGDAPHTLRGCGAQAWAATELYRVLALVERTSADHNPNIRREP